jgi:hypothetical protein
MIGVTMNSIPPAIATDGVFALLNLLADAGAAKRTLSDLVKARDEALAATAAFGDAQARSDALDQREAAVTRSESTLAQSRRDLQEQRDSLFAAQAEHAVELARHQAAVAELDANRVAHEATVRRHHDSVVALRNALGG